MGIRIFDDINMIPARLEDGWVKFNVGTEEFSFYVEALKGKSAPLQCNFNEYLYCKVLLFSDTEAFLLRDDGTGTVYRLGDFVIKKHFKYGLGCAVTRSICINGGYITAIDGLYRELNSMNLIFVGKDNAILSSGKGCIVLPFALRDEQGYLRVLKELQPDCPRLIVNGRTLSVTIGKEVVYTFSTKLIRANTYGTYGGRQVLCE